MNIQKIKSIHFALMTQETDILEGKSEYTKKISVKFKVPDNFFTPILEQDILEQLVNRMYEDLMSNASEEADSLGLWIEYDTLVLDNAISLRTLDDIKSYSKDDTNPVFEFFKMTFQE